MVKRIDPISGALATFGAIKDNVMGKPIPGRENAINNVIKDVTIDTVKAFDTGEWETGIERPAGGGDWTIVEQYENEESARKGHEKWCKLIEKNPNMELEDIGVWDF